MCSTSRNLALVIWNQNRHRNRESVLCTGKIMKHAYWYHEAYHLSQFSAYIGTWHDTWFSSGKIANTHSQRNDFVFFLLFDSFLEIKCEIRKPNNISANILSKSSSVICVSLLGKSYERKKMNCGRENRNFFSWV